VAIGEVADVLVGELVTVVVTMAAVVVVTVVVVATTVDGTSGRW
jgi:hypothetical protein